MTPAERQARRYLWLFPAWMRADRGEEAVGLVADLVPAGVDRLPAAARLDLIRAGLHARRRGTPPLDVWLGVVGAQPRNRSGNVPDAWRPWLISRIVQRRFRVERALVRVYSLSLPVILVQWTSIDRAAAVASWAIATVVGLLWAAFSGSWVRDVCRKNGLMHDGRPAPVEAARPAEFAPAVPNVGVDVLARWGLLVAVAVAVGSGLWSQAPSWRWNGGWAGLAVAVPSGAVAMALLRRAAPRVGDAPRPVATGLRARSLLRVAAGFGGLTALTTLLFAAGADRTIGALPVPIGMVMAFVTASLVARRHAERTGHRLGLWDVAPGLGPLPTFEWLALDPPGAAGPRPPAGLA